MPLRLPVGFRILGGAALVVCVAAAQESQPNPTPKDAITAPLVIFSPDPDYTADARRRGIEGKVYLKLEVLLDGKTNNIRVTKGLDQELDQSAVEIVAHWRFQPATKNGTPVSTEINLVLGFWGSAVAASPSAYTGLPCAQKIASRDIKELLKKASKGDPKAQSIIGCAYQYGVAGMALDRAQAIYWFQKAAEAGLVPAQHYLGEAYLRNFDYVKAYTWLKIAELGGYKSPVGADDDAHHPGLKGALLLLSTDQLKEANEQVAVWNQRRGPK